MGLEDGSKPGIDEVEAERIQGSEPFGHGDPFATRHRQAPRDDDARPIEPEAPTTRQSALPPRRGTGRIVGDYEILGELGRGGMGTVYEAISLKLKHPVALKTLNARFSEQGDVRERFRREAETMAQLRHPGIVRVIDFGEDEGLAYLAMDLVEGRSLKDIVDAEGPLAPRRAASIGQKLALALDYAHKRAVLHRDVKPDNILIETEGGAPRLTDFGLAKRREDFDRNLTATDAIMGTPAYMSPEQAEAAHESPDQRADIYSLGASLFFALTGKPVFESSRLISLMNAVVAEEAPPPSRLRPDLDRDLEVIILKCLEKKPEDRYYSAAELAEDLRRYRDQESILAQPPGAAERWRRWRHRHRGAVLAASSASLVALAFLAVLIVRPAYRSWQRSQILERARAEVAQAAREWRAEAARPLEQSGSPEDRIARSEALETEALRPGRVRDRLALWLQELGLDADRDLKARDRELLLAEARRGFDARGLAARAVLARAAAFQELGQGERAEAERLRAYGLAPSSQAGAAALLAIGRRLQQRGALLDARYVFSTLAARPGPSRARAILGLAELALTSGDYERAAGLLQHPDFDAASLPDDKALRRIRGLAHLLHGRRRLEAPEEEIWLSAIPHEEGGITGFSTKAQGDHTLIRVYRFALPRGFVYLGARKFHGVARLRLVDARRRMIAFWSEARGARSIRVLRWTGKALDDVGSVSVDGRVSAPDALRAMGDINGDGLLDLGVYFRRHPYAVLGAIGGQPRMVRLAQAHGSEGGLMAFEDLDGDGCEELVLAANEWSRYCIYAYRGGPEALTGEFEADFSKVIGVGKSLARDPAGGLLISADRDFDNDVGLVFGADLSPHLPDAIWRLRLGQAGDWSMTPVYRAPFEDRDRTRYMIRGRLPATDKTPELLAAYNENEERTELLPPGGGPGLPLPRSGSAALFDLDGDGDRELVFCEPGAIEVFGLGGPAEARLEDLPFDEAALALLILEKAGPVQGRIFLELIAAGRFPAALEPLAKLAAARAIARGGDHSEARAIALEVARLSPGLARDATLQAADHARAEGALEAAERLLTRAASAHARSEEDRAALRRQARVLAGLRALKPIADATEAEAPMALEGAESFAITEAGIDLETAVDSPAELALPLRAEGSDGALFRARAQLRLRELDYGAALCLRFEGLRDDRRDDLAELAIELTGSGDPSSWRFGLRAQAAGRPMKTLDLPPISAEDRLDLELLYQPAGPFLEASLRINDALYRLRFAVNLPLFYPRYRWVLSPGLARPGSPIPLHPRSFIRAEIRGLSFDAVPGDWSLGSPAPLGAAGAALLRGDLAEARRRLDAADPKARRRAEMLWALRTGPEQTRALAQAHSKAFAMFWRDALFCLKEPERRSLRDVLGHAATPKELLEKGRALFTAGDPFNAALAFDGAGASGARSELAGQCWFEVGAFARSRAIFSGLEAMSPRSRFAAGAASYLCGAPEEALRFWSSEEGMTEAEKRVREPYVIVCQGRVHARHKSASRAPR